ncbi:MAG: peptidylprolyl isomerase [Lachnospiraceae bacterium]|nr:peptidylprolyl isomerase [Lachnospiraceae bacterium]
MTKLHQRLSVLLAAALCICLLSGCGEDGAKVVLTSGFGKEDVFLVGDELCTLPEVMIYLTNIQNEYEQVYGTRIWEASFDGMTLEENIKEMVLAQIAQIKTMYLMARDAGITLSEGEEKLAAGAAKEYYASLTEKEVAALGITRELLEKMYREMILADKAYETMISEINPEISDDEARSVKVQMIFVRTAVRTETGEVVPYANEAVAAAYDRITQVREAALSGEQSFESLANKYSDEDSGYTFSFGKGEMDPVIEEAAFSLETGQISEILKTDVGYYLLKCLSTLDREETDENKKNIIEKQRRDTFEEQYNAYVEQLVRNLNEDLWENVELIHDPEVTTSAFFEVYETYRED